MSERSMEMKVGGLMALSVVLLVGFVVMMGGLSLQPSHRIFVEFENPGGLQSGSPVRIAGIRVGRVQAIEFRGDQVSPRTGQQAPPVRVVAAIDANYKNVIHEDAVFFITAQGVLGEMHLAIEPGTPSRPVLPSDATVLGVSPPRIDQLLGEGYELMHRAYQGAVGREKQIGETIDALHQTLQGTAQLLGNRKEEVDLLLKRADSIAAHSEELIAAVRTQYVDGPRIERILTRLDNITRVLDENLEPMVKDTRTVLKDGSAITSVLAEPEQLETIRVAAKDTKALLTTAKSVASDAQSIVSEIKAGKGSAGALLMDEALYDDLQELVRDLKQNPWKILWKD